MESADTTRKTRSRWDRFLLAAAAVQLAALITLGWTEPAFPFPGIALFALAFSAYAYGLWRLGSQETPLPRWLLWGVAIGGRLSFVPLMPRLSDDVYRYVWDGHVQRMGINPYVFAPSASALAPYRTAWHHLINNPDVPTLYPPLAQGAFALLALLGGSVLIVKLTWIACDLGAGWVLGRVADVSARDRRFVQAAFLWSPLLIVETGWNAHLESLGLLAITLLLLAAWHARAKLSGVALGVAALIKLAPLAAVPPLTRRFGPWAGLVSVALFLGGYVPYARARSSLFTGLGTYARHWRFNEGPYWVIERLAPAAVSPRTIAAVIVVAVVAWTVAHRFDVERALLWILGAGVVLSPTVHPWYVLWLLPMAALRGNRAWLLMTGSAFGGYWGLDVFRGGGEWIEPLPVRLGIWLPFLCVLLWDFARSPQLHESTET